MTIKRITIKDSARVLEEALGLWGLSAGFALFTSGALEGGSHYIFLEPYELFSDSIEHANSLSALREILKKIHSSVEITDDIPHLSGFLSYEYLHQLEKVRRVDTDSYSLPQLLIYRYATVIKITGTEAVVSTLEAENLYWKADLDLLFQPHTLQINLPALTTREEIDNKTRALCTKYSNMDQPAYVDAVERIRSLIKAGNVYQVNLSQQISIPWSGDPRTFFRTLLALEQAEYGAYIRAPNGASIVSLSPELFFERHGTAVRACPIKGTIARTEDPEQDALYRTQLLTSEKDRAELAMIVDLMRNDLGKIAAPCSVTVEGFPRLFSLAMVHHLCADISATVREGITDFDIIDALFPSGSITGTPKIAAMQYISELENTARGPYCGAIGFFGRFSSKWNVAIRTGVIDATHLRFHVGGGITIDSEASAEYEETISKARAFTAAV